MSKLFSQKSNKLLRLVLVLGLSAVLLLGLTMCTQSTEAPVAEEAPAEEGSGDTQDFGGAVVTITLPVPS